MVFFARYLDLFTHFVSLYNTVMKIFFISSSALIIYLMLAPYKGTVDKQIDTFRVEFLVFPAAVLALLFHDQFTVLEVSASPSN